MANEQTKSAVPAVPEVQDPEMELKPLLDFQAGYVLRALDRFPRQGEQAPWLLAMSYAKDVKDLREGSVDDGALRFFSATHATDRAVAA